MRKKLISVIAAAAMIITMIPTVAFGAATSVTVGGVALNDGANTVGSGTATLDKTGNTLTLDGVSATGVNITADADFTVNVKGDTTIGTEASRTNGSSLWTTGTFALNVNIEQGAKLSIYTANGNSIYHKGAVNISGPGVFTGDVSGNSSVIYAEGDLDLKGGLTANVTSNGHGLFAYHGDINVENAGLDVNAGRVGLFAEIYDHDTDDDIPSAVTMKNSTVKLTSVAHGVFCGTGGVLVENTNLTTNIDKDPDNEGYSLYAGGPVTIKGAETVIKAEDGCGIAADGGVLTIEEGEIDSTSTDTALFGRKGVNIIGGMINAKSEEHAAIFAREGAVNITGADTKVTAASNSSTTAAISNGKSTGGDIYIDADVTAVNTADHTPIEAFKKNNSTAIRLGDGIDAYNVKDNTEKNADIYTKSYPDNVNIYFTYFVLAGDDTNTAVTDTVKFCKHTWGEPSWSWNENNSKATAEFTCTKNTLHKISMDGTISESTTPATCAKDGKTVFTASVTFGGTEYTNETTEIIKATGKHIYKDGKCTVCGAADPNYKPADNSQTETTDNDTDNNAANNTAEKDKSADTGDESNMALWLLIMMAACAGMAGTVVYRKKKIQ